MNGARMKAASCAWALVLAACSPETIVAVTTSATSKDSGTDVPVAPGGTGYHTSGPSIVDGTGTPITLHGVTWFGLETNSYSPHGLCCKPLRTLVEEIASLGFDTIRLPWSSELLQAGSLGNNVAGEPELDGRSGLDVMDAVIAEAARNHLKVILSRHLGPGQHPTTVWFDATYGEADAIRDWQRLATHYLGNPAVIGCDLQSDLGKKATWGEGDPMYDWRAAAERIGNAILQVNPDVLVIVEGVETVGTTNYWRGGNLRGVMNAPVRLSPANHVVYATQDFPSSVSDQPPGGVPWIASDPTFPQNLPAVWDANWGYLKEKNVAPVLLVGFGTAYATASDQEWLKTLIGYVQTHDLSFSYWALNPESADALGLVTGDTWDGVHQEVLDVLRPILKP
jgi:endoglucanase